MYYVNYKYNINIYISDIYRYFERKYKYRIITEKVFSPSPN